MLNEKEFIREFIIVIVVSATITFILNWRVLRIYFYQKNKKKQKWFAERLLMFFQTFILIGMKHSQHQMVG